MNCCAVVLVWEDIEFAQDCLRINPRRIGRILRPVPYKGAMPSLNGIKQEYFARRYNKPFRLVFVDSVLSKEQSPAWTEICALIQKAIEMHRFSSLPRLVRPLSGTVPQKDKPAVTVSGAEKEKPDYLKFLASRQSSVFRLITIGEKYEGRSEESHIYRFHTLSGRILIVWENTSASRAAYLFIADAENMEDRLARIEAFVHTGDILFKRSRFRKLRENRGLRNSLVFIGSVRHDDVPQFRNEIQTYINRY